MEATFMKSGFQTSRIVDAFTSLIWTDRYCGYGDFELRLPMTDTALADIKLDDFVSIRESDHYMIVEKITVESGIEAYATIGGRSLESLLDRRFVWDTLILQGNLQDCVMRLLNANLIVPENTNRKIGDIFFIKNADPAVESLRLGMEIEEGTNLYDAIVDICASKHLGFKLIPNENGSIGVMLYKGANRTYSQESNPWVVFSSKYENLKSSMMNMNTEELRNYVLERSYYTEKKEREEWTDESDRYIEIRRKIDVEVGAELSGFERREIFRKSQEAPETIDESAFGAPEDRVNVHDFSTYEMVYFDHKSYYDDDNKAYNDAVDRYYVPKVKEHEVWDREAIGPDDPAYIPEMEGIGQWRLVKKVVPGTTQEEYDKGQARLKAAYEDSKPNPRDYQIWDWVLTNQAGYNRALEEAKKEIAAEIEEAKKAALNLTKSVMYGDAVSYMQQFLTISSFEGELDPLVQFVYGRDYYLGDEVQIVNEFNFQAVTRVVGMMFSEEEGVGYLAMPLFESDDKAVFEL